MKWYMACAGDSLLTGGITPKVRHKAVLVKPTRVLRPSSGGLLIPEVDHTRIGTLVDGGTLLGTLVDPVTHETIEEFRAPFPQTALLLLRPTMSRLEGGAACRMVSARLEPDGTAFKSQGRDGAGQARRADRHERRQRGIVGNFAGCAHIGCILRVWCLEFATCYQTG